MRTAVLDLETTALDAVGGGMIVCGVVKPLGKKAEVFRYDEYADAPGHETKMLSNLIFRLQDFHLLVGHNIIGFDWGMLKSRATILGIDVGRPPMAYDTMLAFRRTGLRTVLTRIGKPTSALDHIIDFFGIPQKKTKIYPREHWKTVWETGEERTKALDNLVAHCVADVQMTEQIYWKLLDLDYVNRIKRLP